jgi:thiol-disulfide isomerase/thioredoxin
MPKRAWLVLLPILAGGSLAFGQDQPKTSFPDDPTVKKDAAPKSAVASDAKAALASAVRAMAAARWIGYTAKVEGVGMPGELTAQVTLERADAGGWKIALKGEQLSKASKKGRPIEVAFDGATIRSLRDLDKTVGQLSNPADLDEMMVFFAKEKADKSAVTLEAAAEVNGEKCNVVRVASKDAKPAGEGLDAPAGLYYFSVKDGLLRRIERLKPNAKPGDKPVRTVTFSEVSASADAKGGDFVIQVPKNYTVKTESGRNALKPIEKAKEDAKAPAKATGLLENGKDAPAFDLKDSEGNAVRLQDLKGKVVVLDFWATWCGPCKAAMPKVQKVSEKYEKQGVVVLGMHTDKKSDDKAAKVASDSGAKYTVVLDAGTLSGKFKVTGIPAIVVIGKDGKVAGSHVGNSPDLEKELSEIIDEALKN